MDKFCFWIKKHGVDGWCRYLRALFYLIKHAHSTATNYSAKRGNNAIALLKLMIISNWVRFNVLPSTAAKNDESRRGILMLSGNSHDYLKLSDLMCYLQQLLGMMNLAEESWWSPETCRWILIWLSFKM